ncbi:hypothetical protein NZK35_08640 [Stieleria sp. ICT_E10.1]|uniref:imm11 family protein n=1 Tax=Stieleria sedimenti TaxID=2976331 RepID=UPI00217F7569|nr:DUF1629 domain-containing protein [Stieleria sedimenti]MCS7466709.1 hypothetical protein [Stieleria sedimenti]
MYWVWTNRRESEDEATVSRRPAVISERRLRFDDGSAITEEVPLIEIDIDADSGSVLTENLVANATTGLLFSEKLRKVLQSVGVDNLQYFDCVIHFAAENRDVTDYRLANIVGRVACVDESTSDFMYMPSDPTEIMMINKLGIDESKIEDLLMLRLHEYDQIILVHEKVKQAVTEAGISGVQFFKPEDYSP